MKSLLLSSIASAILLPTALAQKMCYLSSTNVPYGAKVSAYDSMLIYSRLKMYSALPRKPTFYAHYSAAKDAATNRFIDVDNVVRPGGVDLESGSDVSLVSGSYLNITALFKKIAYLKDGSFANMSAITGYAQYRQATELTLESSINATMKEMLKVSFVGATKDIALEGWTKNLVDKKDWRWEKRCALLCGWFWVEYTACKKCVWQDSAHTTTTNGASPISYTTLSLADWKNARYIRHNCKSVLELKPVLAAVDYFQLRAKNATIAGMYANGGTIINGKYYDINWGTNLQAWLGQTFLGYPPLKLDQYTNSVWSRNKNYFSFVYKENAKSTCNTNPLGGICGGQGITNVTIGNFLCPAYNVSIDFIKEQKPYLDEIKAYQLGIDYANNGFKFCKNMFGNVSLLYTTF